MTVEYIKVLVIKLDPLCESKIVEDINCKPSEIEKHTDDLRKKYPDENTYLIIIINQTMTLKNK